MRWQKRLWWGNLCYQSVADTRVPLVSRGLLWGHVNRGGLIYGFVVGSNSVQERLTVGSDLGHKQAIDRQKTVHRGTLNRHGGGAEEVRQRQKVGRVEDRKRYLIGL